MALFCRHNWKLIDRTILASAYEQISKGKSVTKTKGDAIYFRKAIVFIFQCSKCSEIKDIIHRNP